MTTPAELLTKAAELFDASHATGASTRTPDQVLGEIPFASGQVLVATRFAVSGPARSFTRFRVWALGPNGARTPMRGLGFSLAADALPGLAELVSRALDVELAELPWARQDGRRLPRPEDSVGNGAAGTQERSR